MSQIYDDFVLDNYNYTLPPHAIAQSPSVPRESAKLLVYERKSGKITHSNFYHFSDFVPKDTLLVFNDTKVLKARIYAHKLTRNAPSQKQYEIFFHKPIIESSSPQEATSYLVQIKGRIKCGDRLILTRSLDSMDIDSINIESAKVDSIIAIVQACYDNGMRKVIFTQNTLPLTYPQVLCMLNDYGHIPLPPYIKRDKKAYNAQDAAFYQSIFAKSIGSIAAPTASLHFGEQSMEALKKHFETCFITLHIGAGTFKSVDCPDIRQYNIHTESFSLSPQSAKAIDSARKVLCIGTTSARCVEYYAKYKILQGECDIFLYPSINLRRVDYLLTNFHLPKSSLIMLVSAMIGRKECLRLYEIALQEGYKFYSYGDGMLIL